MADGRRPERSSRDRVGTRDSYDHRDPRNPRKTTYGRIRDDHSGSARRRTAAGVIPAGQARVILGHSLVDRPSPYLFGPSVARSGDVAIFGHVMTHDDLPRSGTNAQATAAFARRLTAYPVPRVQRRVDRAARQKVAAGRGCLMPVHSVAQARVISHLPQRICRAAAPAVCSRVRRAVRTPRTRT